MKKDKLSTNREAGPLDILTNGERAGRDIANECESRIMKRMALGLLCTTLICVETSGVLVSHAGDTKPERRGYPGKFFPITGAGGRALNSHQALIVDGLGGSFKNG